MQDNGKPLSPTLSPLVPRGEREKSAVLATGRSTICSPCNRPRRKSSYLIRLAALAERCYVVGVKSLTIKLGEGAYARLESQAKASKRSKGSLIRELLAQQTNGRQESLGEALADLCGCLKGAKDLSTRGLKGYGRR